MNTPLPPVAIQPVDNAGFLRAIRGELAEGEHMWVAGFADDPAKASGTCWHGRQVLPGTRLEAATNPDHNNYFAVSALTGGKRRAENFARLMVLVADDADRTQLTREPSWVLRTSANKAQIGFILRDDDPATRDKAACIRAVAALAPQGQVKADKSGNSTIRYVRLPVGTNNKASYPAPFAHELVEWRPDVRVPLAEALEAFGVSPEAVTPAAPVEPTGEPISPPAGRFPLGLLANALSALDPSMGRDPWLRIGMALHFETEGAAEGLDAWDAWSADSLTNYTGRDPLESAWASFGKAGHDRSITGGTILKMARDTGWTEPAEWIAADFDALPSPSVEEAAESEAARQRNAEQQADDARIAALAVLSLVDYERQREEAAEALGVRVSILDKLVLAQRPAGDSDAAGDAVMFPELDPWPDPVDGATLLDDVAAAVRRYIVLPAHADTALTLWTMFTHAIDAVGVAPILLLKSAEKRCGKTTAMALVQRLARRALPASNITAPALFRSIEAWAPTLLIDEADTFLKESPELNGIINSGHTRPTAFVIRTVGEDFEPRKFSTWGAKAIASIGGQSGTLHDRSIVVELKRRLPGEHVEKLRHADNGLFEQLLRRIVRFVGDNIDAIRASRPELPATLNDRAADNWEPLLAVAAVAGGHWPTKARRAALALSGAQEDGKSIGQELLEDIREIFAQLGEEKIGSVDLLGLLCGDDEKMWTTFNRGRSITPKQISQRLREFKVQSKDVRIGGSVIKGYERRQFDDAFARYLPAATPSDSPATTADSPATALQPNAGAGFGVAGG